LHAIFDNKVSALAALAWVIFTGAVFFYYRKIKVDLFMLAGGCLSGIVVITCWMGKAIFEADAEGGGFLLLAFVVIGLSSGAALWLRQVHKEMLT
jgi:hypothetical protein